MIEKEKVRHIAKLARLGLTEEEIERYQKELSKILDYIEKLKKVKIENRKTTEHSLLKENVWREDEVLKKQFKDFLEQVPEKKNGYLKVKKII